MFRLCYFLVLSLSSLAFSAEYVHFPLPSDPSLALVQSLAAAKTPGVVFSLPVSEWKSADCQAFLYRPSRQDKELTLYDANNRIECVGKTAAGIETHGVLALPKVGVQFYGDFRSFHSSTLVGEGVTALGWALNEGRKQNIGAGLIEPFNLCGDGDCLDANELLTKPTVFKGGDFDTGRIVLTCTQYRMSNELKKTDCYLIDVAE